MKKTFKKILTLTLALVMVLASSAFAVSAENNETETIQFVTTDENGNIIATENLIYIQEVADAYEASKKARSWVSTTFYDLSTGDYSSSGSSASIVYCTKHFSPNSSKRLYYHGEVYELSATIDIYNITTSAYVGSFPLTSQGDGSYLKTGYITGLNTSNYYSVGLDSTTTGNFKNYYYAVSWTAL